MERTQLLEVMDTLLSVSNFKDYCPNGLHVQGGVSITKIALAVSASADVIARATAWGAQALLVHHGYFWRGEEQPLVGIKYQRIRALLEADMNLLAYHLPLDAHPTLGNNAQLADVLRLKDASASPLEPLVWTGQLHQPLSVADFALAIAKCLGRTPMVLGDNQRLINRVAWCTGGAQDYIHLAARLGVDAYLSGEVSERTYHEARELDITYFACGHHATEQFGVQALGRYLTQHYGLETRFFNEDNPV